MEIKKLGIIGMVGIAAIIISLTLDFREPRVSNASEIIVDPSQIDRVGSNLEFSLWMVNYNSTSIDLIRSEIQLYVEDHKIADVDTSHHIAISPKSEEVITIDITKKTGLETNASQLLDEGTIIRVKGMVYYNNTSGTTGIPFEEMFYMSKRDYAFELDSHCTETARIHLIIIEEALEYAKQVQMGEREKPSFENEFKNELRYYEQDYVDHGCIESGEAFIHSKYVPDNIKNTISERYWQLISYKDDLRLDDSFMDVR